MIGLNFFLEHDPNLQDIEQDFTLEVLGTPIGTDIFKKEYVAQNCIKIIRDHDHLTDGFVHDRM